MIRVAQLGDISAIEDCATEAYEKYVDQIGVKPAPMIADFARQVRDEIVYISHDESNQLEGFIVFYPRKDHIHLENVAVVPRFQGKGVGKRLIKFCEDVARDRGFRKVELYTNEKMIENIDLYNCLDYEEIGRWSKEGYNRVFFQKKI